MSESLENLLNPKNENSFSLQKMIKDDVAKIEADLKYSEKECVNIDFLLTMLSRGSIDEDYRYFISKSYDGLHGLLSMHDRNFLNILKCELKPDYELPLDNIENVVEEIKDFQWSNPSVLNYDILSYLITNEKRDELQGFLIAILNQYTNRDEYTFVSQYIKSLENAERQENAIKVLSQEMQKKVTKNMLVAFFGNDSGDLFSRFIKYFADDQLKKDEFIIRLFLEERKDILNYVLENVILGQNKFLEDKLIVINIEVENLKNYNEPIEDFLIKNAMFKVSQNNLDFIMARQGEKRPYFYYDYVRKNDNIKNKIVYSDKIEDFIQKLVLNTEKMNVSTEGVVELIFNRYVLSDTKKKIVEKIENEQIDLTILPDVLHVAIDSISNVNTDLIHSLIQGEKIRKDFNNALCVFKIGSNDDFVEFVNNNINQLSSRIKRNAEIWNDCLGDFYHSILIELKINQESFTEISVALINENIDVLKYVSLESGIPTERINPLTKICFLRKNVDVSSKSIDVFMNLIDYNFDFFIANFFEIKWMCGESWELNMSILLRNKRTDPLGNKVFDDDKLNTLITFISPYNFANIMNQWIEKIGVNEISKIVDDLLNERRLNIWLSSFGSAQILKLCNDYDEYILGNVKKRIEKYCDEKEKPVFGIAAKYDIKEEAVADKNYRAKYSLSQHVIEQLKSHDWNKQNHEAVALKKHIKELLQTVLPNPDLTNELFVVGRNICQAAEAAYDVVSLVRELDDRDLCPKGTENFNPILCGVAFEMYFDRNGDLRKEFKDSNFDVILDQLEKYSNGNEFIAECLKIYTGRFIYVPGDADVIFNISGNVDSQEIEIHSLKCFDIEILSNQTSFMYESTEKEIPWTGFVSALKTSLGKIFAIPQKHLKFELANKNAITYRLTTEKKCVKPLHEIALPINYKRNNSSEELI